MPIDQIIIRRIHLDASVGVQPWERQTRQRVEVDAEVDVDTSDLLSSGDLSQGVDYTTVIGISHRCVSSEHFDLVEQLADRIARALLELPRTHAVAVEVRKFSCCSGLADHVGVKVRRSR